MLHGYKRSELLHTCLMNSTECNMADRASHADVTLRLTALCMSSTQADNASTLELMRKEIGIMRAVSYDSHIVQFFGACTTTEPAILVMEYMRVIKIHQQTCAAFACLQSLTTANNQQTCAAFACLQSLTTANNLEYPDACLFWSGHTQTLSLLPMSLQFLR